MATTTTTKSRQNWLKFAWQIVSYNRKSRLPGWNCYEQWLNIDWFKIDKRFRSCFLFLPILFRIPSNSISASRCFSFRSFIHSFGFSVSLTIDALCCCCCCCWSLCYSIHARVLVAQYSLSIVSHMAGLYTPLYPSNRWNRRCSIDGWCYLLTCTLLATLNESEICWFSFVYSLVWLECGDTRN